MLINWDDNIALQFNTTFSKFNVNKLLEILSPLPVHENEKNY